MTFRLLVLGPLLLSLACSDARTRALDGLHSIQFTPARPKPEFTLTATDGKPFDFRSATAGTVTLLYFGYTNCPDVCPITLSNIAAAMKTLTPEQQSRIRVVFVTTDPARDTLPRLRAWLDNFNPQFIGLRGDVRDINQIEAAVGLPASSVEPNADTLARSPGSPPASYQVGHAAQVIGFTPDDSLRVDFPGDFLRADWENDLPRLLKVGPR